MVNTFYAHSLEGRPKEEWQLLEEHLRNDLTIKVTHQIWRWIVYEKI